MLINSRVKILVGLVISLMIAGVIIYKSDWFQKKFIYPFTYQEIIYQYSLENNVNPFLTAAVIRAESKFNHKAHSPKGAIGLMQMMPETANWVAGQLDHQGFITKQMEDPAMNIRFGTWYLASLKKEFNNNEVLALAAYNAGRGNVKQWMGKYGWTMTFQDIDQIPFKETREYVERVLYNKQQYQLLYGR